MTKEEKEAHRAGHLASKGKLSEMGREKALKHAIQVCGDCGRPLGEGRNKGCMQCGQAHEAMLEIADDAVREALSPNK